MYNVIQNISSLIIVKFYKSQKKPPGFQDHIDFEIAAWSGKQCISRENVSMIFQEY